MEPDHIALCKALAKVSLGLPTFTTRKIQNIVAWAQSMPSATISQYEEGIILSAARRYRKQLEKHLSKELFATYCKVQKASSLQSPHILPTTTPQAIVPAGSYSQLSLW